MYSREWIKSTLREALKEIANELPICRTGTPAANEVSFRFDTVHVAFPPLEGGTDSDFGFGPDVDPEIGIYDMDTISFLQA